jgi:septum formation protein
LKIILASASPRRRQLLENVGLHDFEIIHPCYEESFSPDASPEETVCELSRGKARSVAGALPGDAVIIAADTIVYLDGEILGKPRDELDACAMLKALSGREHRVFTGVTVLRGEREITSFECTLVRFRELSDREIAAYVQSGESFGKAGAYGAQGLGALLVERIEGDYFNVVGLPLCRLARMLEELGVRLL